MNEDFQSLLLAPAALYIPLVVAIILTIAREPRRLNYEERNKLVGLFLVGIALQSVHFVEEFVTRAYERFPPLFGLAPVPAEAFVGFNLFWIGIWAVAAAGILKTVRAAYFPAWFFGLGMCLNGIGHPLLSLWTGGYFPGLFTAPFVGIIGFWFTKKLFETTIRKM